MESKLNSDELNALQSLHPDRAAGVTQYRDGDLPQRLFAFNLVARQPSGVVLTRDGERALFRHACRAALEAIEGGATPRIATGVHKWLLSGGFIEPGRGGAATPTITQRGKLWLESFKDDAAVAEPEITASDFARRRA